MTSTKGVDAGSLAALIAEFQDRPETAPAWELAMHLISEHADPMAICRNYDDNSEQHHHEHTGPGTIRGHSPGSRVFSIKKIELVLEDIEDEDPNADLDAAHRELQALYPALSWTNTVNAAVSRALETGFELGRDYANRYPS